VVVEENLDPSLELVDLAGELESEPSFDGDVVGEFTEVGVSDRLCKWVT